MTDQLADSIKRLREETPPECLGIQTINQLVDLVAEMHKYANHLYHCPANHCFENDCTCKLHEAEAKAAPIAQLRTNTITTGLPETATANLEPESTGEPIGRDGVGGQIAEVDAEKLFKRSPEFFSIKSGAGDAEIVLNAWYGYKEPPLTREQVREIVRQELRDRGDVG